MSGFAGRLLWAIQELERREQKRKIENSEIGRRVAGLLDRTPAYRSQTVGKWLEETEPDNEVQGALAVVLGVDPGWLAFGEASAAPVPAGYIPPVPAAVPSAPPDHDDQVAKRRIVKAARRGVRAAKELEGKETGHPQPGAKGRRRGLGGD